MGEEVECEGAYWYSYYNTANLDPYLDVANPVDK